MTDLFVFVVLRLREKQQNFIELMCQALFIVLKSHVETFWFLPQKLHSKNPATATNIFNPKAYEGFQGPRSRVFRVPGRPQRRACPKASEKPHTHNSKQAFPCP